MKTTYLLLSALLVILSGCSSQQAQEWGKNECYKAPIGEQERCLERLKEAYPR